LITASGRIPLEDLQRTFLPEAATLWHRYLSNGTDQAGHVTDHSPIVTDRKSEDSQVLALVVTAVTDEKGV
jgi:hypothetical protein